MRGRRGFGLPASNRRRGCRGQPCVRVRHLTREDGAALDEVFAGLSDRGRYLRFHAPVPHLPAMMRSQLVNIDGQAHVAFVAETRTPEGWRPLGIARYVHTGTGRAELAVEVADGWHGRGIGRQLLQALREHAADLGYVELHAEVLLENEAVIRLLRKVFPAARLHAQGSSGTMICPLVDQPAPPTADPLAVAVERFAIGVG